jgi:hypothetical protein
MKRRAPLTAGEDTEYDGILLGPKPESEDLLIEETIPLSVEFQFGRSLATLLAGLESVEPELADAREPRSKTIVGFYRIVMQGSEQPPEVGLDFLVTNNQIHPSLSNFRCCFVLAPQPPRFVAQKDQHTIRIGLQPEILLRVLMRQGEQWQETHQVTLQPERTPSVVDDAGERSPLSRPENSASRAAESHISRPRNRAMFWAIGLLSMIGAAGGYLWLNERPAPARRTQVETPLAVHTGFSANRDGSAWKLTWDTTAIEAIKPTAAILSIQDGTGQQDIVLSMADLSSGTIYYSPNSSELAFQLQVHKDGVALAEERIRVLDGIRPITTPLDQAQKADLRSSRFSGSDAAPSRAAAVIAGPPVQPLGTGDDTADTPHRNLPARNFVPPSSGARPPQSLPMLSAAESITTLAIPLPLSPDISSSFVDYPPPPSPVPAVSPTEAQPLQEPAPPPKASASSAPSPSNYVGPKPTKQVQPRFPQGLVAVGPAQVQLRLAIDTKGRVTKVTLLGPTPDPALLVEASKVAPYWEFEPARLNGQPVPSEMNLIFRFR